MIERPRVFIIDAERLRDALATRSGGWQFGRFVIGYEAGAAALTLAHWITGESQRETVPIVAGESWRDARLVCPACGALARAVRITDGGPCFRCWTCCEAERSRRSQARRVFRQHSREKRAAWLAWQRGE